MTAGHHRTRAGSD